MYMYDGYISSSYILNVPVNVSQYINKLLLRLFACIFIGNLVTWLLLVFAFCICQIIYIA
jgi:hypothetical protein